MTPFEGFQRNVDTINGYLDLSLPLLGWTISSNKTTLQDSEGNSFDVWFITAKTTDNVFLFRFTITGHPVEVEGVRITPDSMKIDVEIRWFDNPLNNYLPGFPRFSNSEDHPNAVVGLATVLAAVAGEAKVSDDIDGKPVFDYQTGAFTGFFKWEPTAEVVVQGAVVGAATAVSAIVEDVEANMTASAAAGWSLKAMYFTFEGQRPSVVSWDPEFGAKIDYEQLNAGSLQQISVFVIALCLLFM